MRSIRTQMMLFFSLLILVPILLSSMNVYYTLQNYLKQSYIRHQQQTMNNLAGELEGFRTGVEQLSLRMFGDRNIQAFLKSSFTLPTADQLEKMTRFRQALQTYSSGNTAVQALIVKGRKVIYGDGQNPDLQSYIYRRLSKAEQYAGLPIWDNVPGTDRIALFRQINDNQTDLNRPIGYLFLIIERSQLDTIIHRYTPDKGQQFAVYDGSGRFALRTDSSFPMPIVREAGKLLSDRGHKTRTYGEDRYIIFSESPFQWSLVSWIPEKYVLDPARELFFGILFIALVLIFFSVFIVLFLSHRITKPLKMIRSKMKQIAEGKFALRVPVSRADEVGEVASALNRMSEEIQTLIRKNQEEEAKRRLIQLQTLEYQINPHFLYNTLDSVNMLARKHHDPVIAEIVTYLSRLFRIGLNQGREMITVADEIQHVTYYLKIQEIRFAGQLFWNIEADESIESVKIIKFILQPLVENSINHGIRKRDEAGHIYIRAWAEPDCIVLEVEDDGVGMDGDQLDSVRSSLDEQGEEPEKDHGFGLRNVHQRIQLHYGTDYGLQLASEKGYGTMVTVRLPYKEAKQSVPSGGDDAL